MTPLLIRGGRILDPSSGVDLSGGCLLIEDGRILAIAQNIEPETFRQAQGARVIDARSLVVAPGFVDLHTHLRDPGLEYKETIATGTKAAARGGFTTVCCMPNTEPPLDSRSSIEYVLNRAAEEGIVRVLPIGCVTKGRSGKLLAELGDLADAGCIGFSDDGAPVGDASIMRRALEYANGLGRAIIDHCEDPQLAGGVMHEGWVSTRLGLQGIPAASEEGMVARDLALARQTGAHVHIAHISTAGSVALVRQAKHEGIHVTAEVTPHHLALTHERVMSTNGTAASSGHQTLVYDTNAKMYPPLRDRGDVEACIDGLRDGTIDAIATDHAPHAVQDKLCEFDDAAFGVTMLETAFGLALRAVGPGALTLERLIEALTIGPVRALGLERFADGIGTLRVGAPADVVLFDPEREWTVEPQAFASKGRNTPLSGQVLRGQIIETVFGGELVYELEGARA